jgi:KDO2-lipid IV(A) lauroyltransferase
MRSIFFRIGLPLVDRVVRTLPSGAAYELARVAGEIWYRLAGERRRLVAESLARVCAATGRPASGRALRRMVRAAFVSYASYWVEMLRSPDYRDEAVDSYISIPPSTWEDLEPVLRGGAVVAVPHLGNFEPFGHFMAVHGLRTVAPVEVTEPRELFEFLLSRRVGGRHHDERAVEIVPLEHAFRPMLAALRHGGVAALVADRDLTGDGIEVTMFGHRTTLPAGPATLALRTGKPLMVARVLRTGPDRFSGDAWPVNVPLSGDRRRDTEALTEGIAAGFERAIAEAPEQWWASFQPFWLDQRQRADAGPAGVEA